MCSHFAVNQVNHAWLLLSISSCHQNELYFYDAIALLQITFPSCRTRQKCYQRLFPCSLRTVKFLFSITTSMFFTNVQQNSNEQKLQCINSKRMKEPSLGNHLHYPARKLALPIINYFDNTPSKKDLVHTLSRQGSNEFVQLLASQRNLLKSEEPIILRTHTHTHTKKTQDCS